LSVNCISDKAANNGFNSRSKNLRCFWSFGVGFFAVVMLVHTHTAKVSTLNHVPRVEKNTYATPYQAEKNNANNKSSQPHLQSCGSRKNAPPT